MKIESICKRLAPAPTGLGQQLLLVNYESDNCFECHSTVGLQSGHQLSRLRLSE